MLPLFEEDNKNNDSINICHICSKIISIMISTSECTSTNLDYIGAQNFPSVTLISE